MTDDRVFDVQLRYAGNWRAARRRDTSIPWDDAVTAFEQSTPAGHAARITHPNGREITATSTCCTPPDTNRTTAREVHQPPAPARPASFVASSKAASQAMVNMIAACPAL